MRFRPDIEGLRAVAVLLVIADHAFGLPSGGYVGVDVFFVISGYLITRSLLRERETTGRILLTRFYVRRAARLFPAAAVVILLTALASSALFFAVTNARNLLEAAASLLSVQNWALVRAGTDYLAPGGSVSPFRHFWSLSVEEQFYAIWPWLLLFVWALFRRRDTRADALGRPVLAVCAMIVAVSLAYSVWATGTTPLSAYFSTLTRAWELAVGGVLASASLGLRGRGAAAVCVRWSGLAAIGVAATVFGPATAFPGLAALLPVAGAAGVIFASERAAGDSRSYGRALVLPPVRYLGRISYSLYLWHAPVIVFATVLVPSTRWSAWTAVCASIALAAASCRFIEEPVRRARVWEWVQVVVSRGRRPRAMRALGFAVTAVLVVVLSAAQLKGPVTFAAPVRDDAAPAVWEGPHALEAALDSGARATSWDGLRDALGSPVLRGAPEMDCLRDPVRPDGTSLDWGSDTCSAAPSSAGPLALVLGDSIAMSWMPAVRAALEPLGWRVSATGLQSCPAASASVQERRQRSDFPANCDRDRTAMFAAAVALSPDLVIISSAEGAYGRLVSGASGAAARSEWSLATGRSISAFAAAGTPVVVLGNPPEGVSVADCAIRVNGPADCASGPSRAQRSKSQAESDAVASARVRGERAAFIAVAPWFCVGGLCPIGVDRMLVRTDGGHLTEAFSLSLGTLLREDLVRSGVLVQQSRPTAAGVEGWARRP